MEEAKIEKAIDSGTTITPKGEVDTLSQPALSFSTVHTYHEHIEELFSKNQLLQKIASILVEDPLRRTIEVSSGDDFLDSNVNKKFQDLKCKKTIVDVLKEGIKQGDSGIMPVLSEYGEINPCEEIPRRFDDLIGFNRYTRFELEGLKIQNNLLLPDYDKVIGVRLRLNPQQSLVELHESRFHHIRWNPVKKNTSYSKDYYSTTHYGRSIYVALEKEINTYRKIYEGVGNAAYRGNILVYKTTGKTLTEVNNMTTSQKRDFNDKLSKRITQTIGKDDEMTVLNGASGFPAKDLQEVAEKYIANNLDIPDSRWMGSQTGVNSSSKSDIERYDDKIANFMEYYAMPLIRYVFDIIYKSFNRDDVDYKVVLGQLHEKSDKEKAEIFKDETQGVKNLADAAAKAGGGVTTQVRGTLQEIMNSERVQERLERLKGAPR